MTGARVAAVDMGTNSTRLLVAEVDGERLHTLDRRMRITRLGQGVDASRRLHPEAIDRVVAALDEFRGAIDELGATRVRAVTTSAARDAENSAELLDRCETSLGVRPEVIAGSEEGQLSFRGATLEIGDPAPYLVVDIGGGSTELIVGVDGPESVISLDIGCVRLTEQFLHGDPPAPEELSNAVAYVRDTLSDADRALAGVDGAKTLVGLAGTVSTLAAVELGLAEYDRDKVHHFRLGRDMVEDIFRTLATEAIAQRAHNPGLDPGRVDVIVGGVLIAACVMRHWNFDEMLVSESDILDGIALALAAAAT
ncbi:MAG TPA: Ppx/GppA phosphatase family protein [Acidimicrobiia bacterium]